MKSSWVNSNGKYPYVSRETWWTRYHLLGRKIKRQGGAPTINDRRVAAILLSGATRSRDNAIITAALINLKGIADVTS